MRVSGYGGNMGAYRGGIFLPGRSSFDRMANVWRPERDPIAPVNSIADKHCSGDFTIEASAPTL